MTDASAQGHVDQRVLAYYGTEFDESDRLLGRSVQGVLEFERTQQVVHERVPVGARIVDIGGGCGVHAAALAEHGTEVLLIDPVARHVDAARTHGSFRAQVGDARSLPVSDHQFDAALLLGPLYHLVERSDRLRALREAVRVVRPGGWVFAAGVSRLVAMARVMVIEPSIALEVSALSSGRPLPEKWRRLLVEGGGELGHTGFPGGHFHLADDLEREAWDAGLLEVQVIGLEGPGAQALEFSGSRDPELIDAARTLARAFESQRGLRDLSPHLLAMGRTPS